MHPDLFNDLTQSLKEAAAIAKGNAEPSRRFAIDPIDVKAVRETDLVGWVDEGNPSFVESKST